MHLKTLWGKRENTGNQHFFPFSSNVLYPLKDIWLIYYRFFHLHGSEISHLVKGYPTTRQRISDSSKLKEFADNNFKFDENGRKLSKRVENTVGKGEIARYEQFLLFPHCFQKACFPGASKGVTVWEWVKW